MRIVVLICFLIISGFVLGQHKYDLVEKRWGFEKDFYKSVNVGDTVSVQVVTFQDAIIFDIDRTFKRYDGIRMCGLESKRRRIDKLKGSWEINKKQELEMFFKKKAIRFDIVTIEEREMILVVK